MAASGRARGRCRYRSRVLHVLAATVRVAGQLTLAALVPALRAQGREVSRVAARAFNRVAWPAFGVLILTGAWNMAAESDEINGSYRTTVIVKLAVVALSGRTAYLHQVQVTAIDRRVRRAFRAVRVGGAIPGCDARLPALSQPLPRESR